MLENDEVSSHSEEENSSSELDENSEGHLNDVSSSDQEDGSNLSSNDEDNNDDFNIVVAQSEVPPELQVNIDGAAYDGVSGIENFHSTNAEDDRRKGMATKLQIGKLYVTNEFLIYVEFLISFPFFFFTGLKSSTFLPLDFSFLIISESIINLEIYHSV